jgi:hypothetical protein
MDSSQTSESRFDSKRKSGTAFGSVKMTALTVQGLLKEIVRAEEEKVLLRTIDLLQGFRPVL